MVCAVCARCKESRKRPSSRLEAFKVGQTHAGSGIAPQSALSPKDNSEPQISHKYLTEETTHDVFVSVSILLPMTSQRKPSVPVVSSVWHVSDCEIPEPEMLHDTKQVGDGPSSKYDAAQPLPNQDHDGDFDGQADDESHLLAVFNQYSTDGVISVDQIPGVLQAADILHDDDDIEAAVREVLSPGFANVHAHFGHVRSCEP